MILSPMPRGSGAILIHRELERALPGYRVIPYNPRLEFMPLLLRKMDLREAQIIHTTPDHAIFHTRGNAPLIVTFHNYMLDHYMYKHSSLLQTLHYATDLRFFTQCALKRATAVTAVSVFIAELVKEDLGFKGEIRVIPNGIDSTLFIPNHSNRSGQKIRVLFSGNLTQRKGADLLPNIAVKLAPECKIICTAGLRDVKADFHTRNVEFIGRVAYKDMAALYRSVDILLMPTVREGFGLSVAEAMSCGLPVVATNCSTMPELVHHGQGGFLCSLGSAQDFADRINELAESTELRKVMGDYNRARIESEYRLDRMIEGYKELFEQYRH